MTHPTDRQLELYVMGAPDDAQAVEAHLADCAACAGKVAAEAAFELELRNTADEIVFCCACEQVIDAERDRCGHCGAAVRAGGFDIEQVLVSHARGRLYVARDADDKRVALKELAFVQAPGVEALAAFEREAKFLRALQHPSIPRFVASFQEGDGVSTRLYLAQDYIDGPSLESRLRDHWFDEAECRDILRQVLDVLVYLQGLSPAVIHRDIKPANLLQRDDGSIAVVDFGAAYDQGATLGSTVAGTFGYMPVEQMAGQVDSTTDLYALGASILHLLTRREPWKLFEASQPAAANVSEPLRHFLGKLTARDASDRFASARDARAALDSLDSLDSTHDVATAAADAPRFERTRRSLAYAGIGLAFAFSATVAVATIESLGGGEHRNAATGEAALLCDAFAERYIALIDEQASAARARRGGEPETAGAAPLSRWRGALRDECIDDGGVSPTVLACAYRAQDFDDLVGCMNAHDAPARGAQLPDRSRDRDRFDRDLALDIDARVARELEAAAEAIEAAETEASRAARDARDAAAAHEAAAAAAGREAAAIREADLRPENSVAPDAPAPRAPRSDR